MSSLFLSYRRDDCPGTVKHVFDRLKPRLPQWTLFYDHEVLLPGEVLSERLRDEVISADVVLCVIGPRWADLLKERRDRTEIDHVREEVRLALSARHTVIPLLVEKASMPKEADLADFPELKSLCRLIGQAVRPDPDFDTDIERLAAYLDQLGPGVGAGSILGGKYKVLREIGQGGMGVVYEAEQQKPRRIVAIKMVVEGMDTKEVLARFDGEKEALARMDHPNIASVIDSGSSPSGKPYFVMELVRGEPITTYCDRKRLLLKGRLKLFRQVCSAVQHAHQKGIIHRDIKPSNVLVEETDGQPVPKVIDFGLAKALSGRLTDKTLISETGKTVGTLIYASPEQAAGRQYDIDTRTDIYSLGALLYELLTGAPPFTEEKLRQVGDEAMRRAIIEMEPSKPSTNLSSSNALPIIAANRQLEPLKLTRLVRGDLDWIAMRALEKEPKRRYETASKFSDDIEHYLNDEPVEACPPSTGYKVRKFARKHRAALTTAAAFALLLVIGTAVSTWQAIIATKAKNAARVSEKKAKDQEAKTNNALVAVNQERDRTKQESRKAFQSLADFYLERGRALEEGLDPGGILWLNKALWVAPDDDPNRQGAIRRLLSVWGSQHHELKAILNDEHYFTDAAFSPDGKTVLTGSRDNTARLWSAADGSPVGPPMKHADSVDAVAFSPDGKTVLTGSRDKTARLWSAALGTPVGPPIKQEESVGEVAFSPDGKTVLTGSDKAARLWNAADGSPVGSPMKHESLVTAVAFSPDGKTVLTGSWDKTARLWRAADGSPVGPPMNHEDSTWLHAVAFSPDGKTVLTGSKTARLWSVADGSRLGPPMKHQDSVFAVAFSPDGKTVLTGSRDHTARLWSVADGSPVGEPMKHLEEIEGVAFSPDGKTVLTGSVDKTARLWLAADGSPVGPPMKHHDPVWAVKFSPDGKTVLTRGQGKVRLWKVADGNPFVPTMKQEHFGIVLAFSPDGKTALTASGDDTVRLWSVADGSPLGPPMKNQGPVGTVAFSPDGKTVLTGSPDNTARLWSAADGSPVGPPMKHGDFIGLVIDAVVFSPDGKTVLTGVYGTMRLWRVADGSPLGPPMKHHDSVFAVKFSPDGKIVLIGSYKTAQLWSVIDGSPLGPPMTHEWLINALAFSPDGKTVLTGSDDDTARLWSVADGSPVGQPMKHADNVEAVAYSPDGKIVLTGSHDHTARLWSALDGSPLGPPMKHEESVETLAFSPDGKTVLTGSWDKTARLWSVADSAPVAPPMKHQGEVYAVSFSPDGKTVLTVSKDNTARLWSVADGSRLGPPMKHEDFVNAAAFSRDGKLVLTLSRNTVGGSSHHIARLWHGPTSVAGDPRRVLLWSQVITGLEINEKSNTVEVLDAPTWRERRRELDALGGPPLP